MEINFRYSVVYDLIYHILAHIKVENASNLYSEDYIDKIKKIKSGNFDNISKSVSHLIKYYNENFERLGIINFLPFYTSTVEEMVETFEKFNGFSEIDKSSFVYPLNQIIKQESLFYKNYWNELHNSTKANRKTFELFVKNEFEKFSCIFSYFRKTATIGMSYSLTCNGRGLGSKNTFIAVVPFPLNENDYQSTFYQILHEYTHSFTDGIIGNNIRMDDGTHDLSEFAVILFDYYLIKNVSKNDLDSYLKWINSIFNIDNLDEQKFLSVFEIKNDINNSLIELAETIAETE